ncbi:hypothetical protein ACFPVX_14820 [Cohnella faecalis]|uniref:Uncharacterized protein n=1 Tax=Cohnella faecalis TaxID=2315694 RepID=A0A398CP07_9BACL|nr:hypothetical protein [Cohnella faecalis]RIE02488.1 hypothetical protein D3H35_17480 [Cohnella faecalis]
MSEHTNRPNADEAEEPKKVSLGDAMKQMLERKKQAQAQARGPKQRQADGEHKMKTQIHKVQNNQKRRTGV